jgi:pilus assembly protein CpaC
VNQIANINPVSIGAAPFGPVGGAHAGAIPFAISGGGLTTNTDLTLGFPRVQLQIFFNAMRDNRLLRVLAEPNLAALSGQEASFLAGGEFPFQVPQSLGTTTIEWKNFGIQLRFTPTVIGRDMIRLRVAPEVSDLDFTNGISLNGVTVPALTSRRAETTIELPGGSTIAIAGLLSERVRGITQKMPGLGDVPVLGALFSSVSYQKDQTELVILVTPEIATCLGPDQVNPVPGQFMTDPDDFELMGLGMLEGKPACEDTDPAGALQTKTPPRYPKCSSPPEQMTLHGPWGPADAGEATQ